MAGARMLLHPAAKPIVFIACLLPLAWMLGGVMLDRVGPNPAEYLIRATGDWALRFLCLVLAVTPLRLLAGLPALARFRRMLGLFVYFYVVLHALSYGGFDMGFVWADLLTDIGKRPFVLVGFAAFLLLTSLAATSFNRAIRWLGATRWQAFVHVLLPLLRPALFSASALVFAFAFGAYEVPLVLGAHAPQALAVLAWQAQTDTDMASRPQAMAMAVLIALVGAALLVAHARALGRGGQHVR